MTKVTQLPPGIERRKCPGCGYMEDQLLIDRAYLNFQCPRCGKYKQSEFILDAEPEPPKPGKRMAA